MTAWMRLLQRRSTIHFSRASTCAWRRALTRAAALSIGASCSHYPATVAEVIALEPERHLRERAQLAAADARVAVSVREGHASRLPCADGEFDVGVASLVLCTV